MAALAPALYVALMSTRELFVFERAGELLGLCVRWPFYEALGYVRLGSASNRLPSGVELPCVMMRKRLE